MASLPLLCTHLTPTVFNIKLLETRPRDRTRRAYALIRDTKPPKPADQPCVVGVAMLMHPMHSIRRVNIVMTVRLVVV
eukprot:m.119834 g.119834  ORF g.119834 m.119834 type:complete len:78 (+) comp11037_c2_seq1:786-1019(+)